jgi:hypothetical protein
VLQAILLQLDQLKVEDGAEHLAGQMVRSLLGLLLIAQRLRRGTCRRIEEGRCEQDQG